MSHTSQRRLSRQSSMGTVLILSFTMMLNEEIYIFCVCIRGSHSHATSALFILCHFCGADVFLGKLKVPRNDCQAQKQRLIPSLANSSDSTNKSKQNIRQCCRVPTIGMPSVKATAARAIGVNSRSASQRLFHSPAHACTPSSLSEIHARRHTCTHTHTRTRTDAHTHEQTDTDGNVQPVHKIRGLPPLDENMVTVVWSRFQRRWNHTASEAEPTHLEPEGLRFGTCCNAGC